MIYCQSCATANPDDAEVCIKCGTRLLILGGNAHWDDNEQTRMVSIEDHFLERISNLEETMNGILEHMTRMSETVDVVERNGFVTRSGLNALVETLRETNLLREELLYRRWESTMMEQMEEARIRDRFRQMRGRFLALYRGEAKKKSRFIALIDEAEFLIYSDRPGESLDPLGKALKLDQENYELAYYIAEALQSHGHFAEAEGVLRTALSANEEHPDALLLLALNLVTQERVEEARALFHRCLEVAPRHASALLSMGSLLTAEGDYEQARTYLERAVEIEPNAQGYYLLGLGAREMDRLKDAIDYLAYATELDPDHEDAVFSLGLAYLKRGWTRKARTCFAQALELNPNKVEFQEALGLEEERAVQKENEDGAIDDETAERFQLAQSLMKAGKYKQALPHYRRLLKQFPDDTRLMSHLAVLTYSLRKFDETLKMSLKLLEMETDLMMRCVAYTMAMESMRSLAHYDEAVALMYQMMEEFPDGYGRTVACTGLALTKADTGRDLREAEQLAREALKLSPPDFRHNVMDALGWVFFKQGRYEEALELLRSAVSMHETLNHLYHFGMVLLALNLQEEAFKVYERIVKLRARSNNVDEFIFAAINGEMPPQEPAPPFEPEPEPVEE